MTITDFTSFMGQFFLDIYHFLFTNSALIGGICIGHFLVVFIVLGILIGFFLRGA